ncbi:MAG: hypothetical protein PHD43_18670 [Methylococcales bacterium]|nr:hypothetical protein [Methylococcales bacterium]
MVNETLLKRKHIIEEVILFIVFALLLYTGRLNYESTGLIVELILGFSLFLDGRNLGWRY